MSELETSFAMLVGRQPSDKDRQDLYRVRDTLKLKANDAMWSVLMMLQHYEWLYSRHPAAIAESVKEVTKTVRETALAQARAAAAETTKALAHAVAEAATASAKRAAGAQRLKWMVGCVIAVSVCLTTIGWWAHSRGERRDMRSGTRRRGTGTRAPQRWRPGRTPRRGNSPTSSPRRAVFASWPPAPATGGSNEMGPALRRPGRADGELPREKSTAE